MTLFVGPLFVIAMLAQAPGDRVTAGTVVDDQGKPIAGAEVVFHGPTPMEDKTGPVEVCATTGAGGEFRLDVPAIRRLPVFRCRSGRFDQGLAIASSTLEELSRPLVLRKAESRTIRIEGPDGQPVVGGGSHHECYWSLPRARFGTSPNHWPNRSRLRPDKTVRRRSITWRRGIHWWRCASRPSRSARKIFRLSNDSSANARVPRSRSGSSPRAAWPAVSERVRASRLWVRRSKSGSGEAPGGADLVVFKNGPIRTKEDGSFQTPENLLVGSAYRLVVRAPGKGDNPLDWITIGDRPRVLLPMLQRPLRTVSGRVVDRQRMPLAGIEVFQSGDGPERTSTRTGADGRFALSGFHEGSVFGSLAAKVIGFPADLSKPANMTSRSSSHEPASGRRTRCGCFPRRFHWRSCAPWPGV